MRTFGITVLLCLSACTMGYWPKVDGAVDQTKYQADVRECQTIAQADSASVGSAVFGGGLLGAAFQARDSESPEGRAAIDKCMTEKGYHVVRS